MTVQKDNLRMGIKIFSKNQEKTKDFQMLKQIRTRIEITNRLNLQQSRLSPAESPVLLYRIMHLITIGLGLPTYSITCRQLTSKVQNRKQEGQKDLLVKRRSILAILFLSVPLPKSSGLLLFHLSRKTLPDTRRFMYI